MLDWLDRQRGKSKEARVRTAFTVAVVVTAVVVLFWAVSLPARLGGLYNAVSNDRNNISETDSEERSGREPGEMFDGFNELLEEGRNDLREAARSAEEAAEEVSTTSTQGTTTKSTTATSTSTSTLNNEAF